MTEKKQNFGRPKSNNPRKNAVTVRLTDEELLLLKNYADQHAKTMTQVILGGIKIVCTE